MLSKYRKERKNASAKVIQKKVAEAKREAKKAKKVVPVQEGLPDSNTEQKQKSEQVVSSDSDSEVSDSSDSEYEEILISNLPKKNQDVQNRSERSQITPSNHSNHFTEPEKSKPIDIPKRKSKKIVIKKYYNYKPKSERNRIAVSDVSEGIRKHQEPKLNYLGFNTNNNSINNDTRNHITNRIFNW